MPNAPVPDRFTRSGIAAIADARAHGWRLVGELLGAPDPPLVERLRSGVFVGEFRMATDWLADGAGRFLDSFMALDAYARRAARRTEVQDLADIRAEHPRLFPGGPPFVVDAAREMVERCEAEAAAWASGDHEQAKRLRQEQFEAVETDLVDSLPAWCAWLAEEANVALYRTTARLVSSYLSVESGRDFDRLYFSD